MCNSIHGTVHETLEVKETNYWHHQNLYMCLYTTPYMFCICIYKNRQIFVYMFTFNSILFYSSKLFLLIHKPFSSLQVWYNNLFQLSFFLFFFYFSFLLFFGGRPGGGGGGGCGGVVGLNSHSELAKSNSGSNTWEPKLKNEDSVSAIAISFNLPSRKPCILKQGHNFRFSRRIISFKILCFLLPPELLWQPDRWLSASPEFPTMAASDDPFAISIYERKTWPSPSFILLIIL